MRNICDGIGNVLELRECLKDSRPVPHSSPALALPGQDPNGLLWRPQIAVYSVVYCYLRLSSLRFDITNSVLWAGLFSSSDNCK